jgi:hypothetical protein
MPILTQPDPHPKRRRPWLWVLVAVPMVLMLLGGLVAWCCHRGMFFGTPTHWVAFGNTPWIPQRFPPPDTPPGYGYWLIKLPGGRETGWYTIIWTLPMSLPRNS